MVVTLFNSDQQINLIEEGIDLAVRLGTLSDSALKSRKISTFERILVAAPSYLATIETLTEPADLNHCDFVLLDMLPEKFELIRENEKFIVQPERSRILVDSVNCARSAVLAGLGIQKLPLSEVGVDLAAGRLVRVLPEWSLPMLNIYAV